MFFLKMMLWIIAYTVGIARLSMACILLKREKRRLDYWKVAFLLVFSLVIISLTNMEVVISLNQEDIFLFAYLSEYAAALIVMTLPVYIHAEFEDLRGKSIRDIFFISLSLLLCLLLTISFLPPFEKWNRFIFSLVIAFMAISIIYSNLLPLLNKKARKDTSTAVKILNLSVILLTPLMIWIDFFNNHFAGFIILPLMYLDINILMILTEIGEFTHKPMKDKSHPQKAMAAFGLTNREQEVALHLLKGLTYQEVADQLCISIQTVKTHANRIYTKTETKNKLDLLNKLR